MIKSNVALFILGAVAAVAILLGIAYFAVRHEPTTPSTASTNLTNVATSTTPSGTVKNPGYTIEAIPTTSIKDIEPNLDRAIVFGATVPDNVRTILAGQHATLVASLKADPMRGADWFDLGVVYYSSNDYQGAKEIWEFLTKAIKPPQAAVAYDNLGKMYKFDLKDFPKSEQYFKASMQIDPTSITPYIELFGLYSDLYKTDTSAAVDILILASKKFPTNADPFVLLGEHYRDRNDSANARLYFNKALVIVNAAGDVNRAAAIQGEIDRLPQ